VRAEWVSYDGVATAYDAISVPNYFQVPAERLVARLGISPSDDVLDLGAGTGAVAAVALDRARTVTAADLSWRMLRLAGARSVARRVSCDLSALPFRPETFDRITASFVLSHLADPDHALEEAAKLLRVGGRLGATAWATGPSDGEAGLAWTEVARRFVPEPRISAAVGPALPGEERLKELSRLGQLLSGAGFDVVVLERLEYPIPISTRDYLGSKAIALTARFLRSVLTSEAWQAFEHAVADELESRFGQRLELTACVNLVVGSLPRKSAAT